MLDLEFFLWIAFIFAGWAVACYLFILYLEQKHRANFLQGERDKLQAVQNKAFGKIVESHSQVPAWKKKAQIMPKLKRPLKLVASGGKRLYEANVVTVDFRSKSKKDPNNSGPKGVA